MASFKIMLIEHKRRADKTYPLAMRITADRLSKYIYMNVYLLADQWDESNQKVRKNHPNATLINTFLQDKLLEAQKVYLNQEVRKKSTTTGELKKRIKNQRTGTTFFQFAQDYLDMLSTAGKIKVYKSDNSRINNFREFRKSEDLHFEDVTTELLKQFISWLQGKKESKPRSIVNHLILIRTLYNKAIGDNIVEQNYYPFGRGKLTIRIPESQKIGLNEDEIKKIENLDLSKNPNLKHARNVFLVSFYLAGIRIGDLLRLKWADFKNGRLHYIMGKNNKPGSIKINEKVMEILAQYEPDKPSPKALVFPDLTTANVKDPVDLERKVNTATKNLNTRLKKIATLATIDKNMFNHIARHSFGNIAGDKIPLPVLKNLYRHSSIITTANYQQSFTKGC